MKRIKLADGIGLVLLVAMLITSPLTGQYVNQAIDWAFQEMFKQGAWVGIVGASYMVGYLAYRYIKSERINIPAKPVKA